MEIQMISELKRLIQFKDLLFVIIWRDFNVRFRQSVFGCLWAILQPLSLMALFLFVFHYFIPLGITRHPYPPFFYIGLLCWIFFSSSLNLAIPIFTSQYDLIRKVYFPRIILPLSAIVLTLADYILASPILLLLLIIFKIPFAWTMLWFFPLSLLLILFTTAVSLFLSSLNVYYRDVRLLSGFLIQLWFFVTPVFYSMEMAPDGIQRLLYLNPLTYIVYNMRLCFLEERAVSGVSFLLMSVLILGLLYTSIKFLNRVERRFADVI